MNRESEARLAVLSILVYDREQAQSVNDLLHEFGDMIVGRLGIPYKERNLSVICVVVDASNERIGNLAGKLGRLDQVACKVLYQKAE